MKVVGVIPSRYSSTRLPGKPLKDICGKSMVQRVYERAKQSKLLDEVIVATDDKRIAEEVERFKGKAVMTSVNHPNGTSRIAEAIKGLDFDLIINIQGDEPFIRFEMIDELIEVLIKDENRLMATLCYELHNKNKFKDENVVKVVCDIDRNALYFSRSLIPFPRKKENYKVYEHIGIYGYRKSFLQEFVKLDDTPLSIIESLEQLKVLEYGYKLYVAETKYNYNALSIDTQEDLEEARRIIENKQDYNIKK
ncbi:MAG TPA: 3-deoxy-manno-octulosonate cytidylyltransferase [Candidatus Atribacteria bacterium]|jgi:3-deoxy-manno-octulosonate cytidylyltransferase (CMP-KDO synthetase)|nr:3-deoxy-manno-octulosonate cytidylyltransferase [Candidatus Atribacteria bacterium]